MCMFPFRRINEVHFEKCGFFQHQFQRFGWENKNTATPDSDAMCFKTQSQIIASKTIPKAVERSISPAAYVPYIYTSNSFRV